MRVNIDDTEMDDGQRFRYHGALLTGELVETDQDGNIIAVTAMQDGVAHGPDRAWYANGVLQEEIEVVDGRAVGTSRRWHPNGALAEEQEIDDGQVVAVRRWTEDGTPITVYTYFGAVTSGSTRTAPTGVARRCEIDGDPHDEAFTANLRWEPTSALLQQQLGYGDTAYVEISEAEAEAFVRRRTEDGTPIPEDSRS